MDLVVVLPSAEQSSELDALYHATHVARERTQVQMILLAVERGLVAARIAAIMRQNEESRLGCLDGFVFTSCTAALPYDPAAQLDALENAA